VWQTSCRQKQSYFERLGRFFFFSPQPAQTTALRLHQQRRSNRFSPKLAGFAGRVQVLTPVQLPKSRSQMILQKLADAPVVRCHIISRSPASRFVMPEKRAVRQNPSNHESGKARSICCQIHWAYACGLTTPEASKVGLPALPSRRRSLEGFYQMIVIVEMNIKLLFRCRLMSCLSTILLLCVSRRHDNLSHLAAVLFRLQKPEKG
jgi:hypothetical protein